MGLKCCSTPVLFNQRRSVLSFLSFLPLSPICSLSVFADSICLRSACCTMSWLRDLVLFSSVLSVAIPALSERIGAEVLKFKLTMEVLFYLFLYPSLSLPWRISQGRLPVCGITIVIPTSWHLDFISSLLEAVPNADVCTVQICQV